MSSKEKSNARQILIAPAVPTKAKFCSKEWHACSSGTDIIAGPRVLRLAGKNGSRSMSDAKAEFKAKLSEDGPGVAVSESHSSPRPMIGIHSAILLETRGLTQGSITHSLTFKLNESHTSSLKSRVERPDKVCYDLERKINVWHSFEGSTHMDTTTDYFSLNLVLEQQHPHYATTRGPGESAHVLVSNA